jgi:hypothetical protein
MIRPLILGGAEEAELARVKEYAEAHPIPLADIVAMRKPPDDRPFYCQIPTGYHVLFSIEEHCPGGWVRHLSVWVEGATSGSYPNSFAVRAIGVELGMRMNIFDPSATSSLSEQPPYAINIIEPIDPSEPGEEPTYDPPTL